MHEVNLPLPPALPPKRRLTKHAVMLIGAALLPVLLVLVGFGVILVNLPTAAPPAKPALSHAALASIAAGPSVEEVPDATIPSAGPSVDPQRHALELAQQLATDLASHDVAAAKTLTTFARPDAEIAASYARVTKLTVVPVDVIPVGPSRFELRLGLVSNESSNKPTTTFFCVVWFVDSAANSIAQLHAEQLSTMPGDVTSEQNPGFVRQCHAATFDQ